MNYNKIGTLECSICGRLRSTHHFHPDMLKGDPNEAECNYCLGDSNREPNSKCMRCQRKFSNKDNYQFGICDTCKKSDEYSVYGREYSVNL